MSTLPNPAVHGATVDPPRRARRNDALHVVHGVLTLDAGGLERIVLDLVRAGRECGQRVSVLCVERPGVLAAAAQQAGAEVISLGKPPGRVPGVIPQAAAVLAGLRPDIIHTHQIGALWYLGPAAQRANRAPILHTEHGNLIARAGGWRSRLKARLIVRRAARHADRFCCVSDEIALAVMRFGVVPRSKVEIAVNGVRTDVFADHSPAAEVRSALGIPPDSPVIGTVGRLNEIKHQHLLLGAVARLQSRFPDLHLVLVGDGPERPRLEAAARRLDRGGRVHFTGYQAQPERFLPAMNVFALTSRSEGLPVALLEAWAAGLPVVCSAVGAIPRVVTPGVNGLLFPSGDEAALCDQLALLLSDRQAATALGRAGQALVRKRYSLERMAADYAERYRELLEQKAGRR